MGNITRYDRNALKASLEKTTPALRELRRLLYDSPYPGAWARINAAFEVCESVSHDVANAIAVEEEEKSPAGTPGKPMTILDY